MNKNNCKCDKEYTCIKHCECNINLTCHQHRPNYNYYLYDNLQLILLKEDITKKEYKKILENKKIKN